MHIVQGFEQVPTQAACIAHLQKARWGDMPRCPSCHSTNTARTPTRPRCDTCKTSFSVTVGTLFQHTHVPLQK